GRCALAPLGQRWGNELAVFPVATVDQLEVPVAHRVLRRANRADQLALAAALAAARDAALPPSTMTTAAVVLGVGAGGAPLLERYLDAQDSPAGRAAPSDLAGFPAARTTDLVARELRADGPRMSFMTACSSSALAIGYAADLVAAGRVSAAFAGGAEPLARL